MNANELLEFLREARTSTRASRYIAAALEAVGFIDIEDAPRNDVEIDGLYIRSGGSIIALRRGTSLPDESGVLVLAAHTDSPGLHLKDRGAAWNDGIVRVPIEVYGSPILASWVDRDLAIVGRVALSTPSGTEIVEIEGCTPRASIPNVAIHYNHSINESLNYDRHEQLPVLLGIAPQGVREKMSAREYLLRSIAPEIPYDQILDVDLRVVPAQPPALLGDRLLASDRLDDLSGCYSNLDAFRRGRGTKTTAVLACVDHEEIGSVSSIGAAGSWIKRGIERLLTAHGVEQRQLDDIVRRSVVISNDAAHARHPSYGDKHDPAYAPVLGGGPVLKRSATLRYVSGLPERAWITAISREIDSPLQHLQNRADIPAGSTIGPAIASRLSAASIDIGVPLLAMHSAREMVCLDDVDATSTLIGEVLKKGIDEISDAH